MVRPVLGPVEERDAPLIGGGAAEAAVASLLAAWGHSVLILPKPGPVTCGLAESLPPSTRKLLARVGVLDSVERAGFYRRGLTDDVLAVFRKDGGLPIHLGVDRRLVRSPKRVITRVSPQRDSPHCSRGDRK